ncbi:MAG: hypothetical protein IMZ69_05040 [Spirochaetes bacterium]|nr:hypothetical protein [Spirochaetota bacterium]
MVLHGRVNAAVMCQFVDRLMQGAAWPVFRIFDGHPAHKAKKLREHIENCQGKLPVPAPSSEIAGEDPRLFSSADDAVRGVNSCLFTCELVSIPDPLHGNATPSSRHGSSHSSLVSEVCSR